MRSPTSTATGAAQPSRPFRFNPFDRAVHADPYPAYAKLRQDDPVHWSFLNAWILTRYDDVKAALRDRRLIANNVPQRIQNRHAYLQQNENKELEILATSSSTFFFWLNPPDHTRLRSLVSKAFSKHVVAQLRPQIQSAVDELLDTVRDRGEMDLIADLAGPLPVRVISDLLGVPTGDREHLHEWSSELSRILDPLMSLKAFERLNQHAIQFDRYFRQLIAQRERHPQEDLISQLVAVRDGSDRLSQDELVSICMLLFVTGEETTVNTVGNGMLALLEQPDQLQRLRECPDLIDTAVEELLRFDSPVQSTARIATEDFELGGKQIQAGDTLSVCLAAANRDPARFPNPDQLDIARADNPHLAFGDGIHYCLGAALARVQAQIAINTLLQEFDSLALANNQRPWRSHIVLRGLTSLPLTVVDRARSNARHQSPATGRNA